VKYTGGLLAILIVPLVLIGGAIVMGLPGPDAQKLLPVRRGRVRGRDGERHRGCGVPETGPFQGASTSKR